ncbi:Uncharacterised protein [Vibrio cholerae]|nr:Uncharacterised protein [Vibrio cholerae]
MILCGTFQVGLMISESSLVFITGVGLVVLPTTTLDSKTSRPASQYFISKPGTLTTIMLSCWVGHKRIRSALSANKARRSVTDVFNHFMVCGPITPSVCKPCIF